jgi:phosphoribosyl-ATP pyrophosphohydrolase
MPKKKEKAVAKPPSKPSKAVKAKPRKRAKRAMAAPMPPDLQLEGQSGQSEVLDRLWNLVMQRRGADPSISHSARLLSRGTPKVAQKFGEEAVECLIEAVAGNKSLLIGESADVLYHLIVLWVACDVRPDEVWAELERREGVSGIAEKAARPMSLRIRAGTRKIP